MNIPKGWKEVQLIEVLDYEQPNEYIIEKPLKKDENLTPVLTANKSFIKGYTDETKGIYKNVPVIIFDDFTADNKFVNFPFKVKSSAMKILKSKYKNVLLKYVFYQMQLKTINTTTHKRYYLSKYQNLNFLFPIKKDNMIDLQTQLLIVSEIEKQFTRLDESIKSLKSVKEKLKVYRKAVLKTAFYGNLIQFDIISEDNLSKVSEKITDGTHLLPPLQIEGVPMLDGADIDDKFNIDDSKPKKFISFDIDKELAKKCKPLPGDILITSRGTIGKVGLVKENQNFNIMGNIILVRIKKDVLNLKYTAFNLQFLKYEINNLSRGTTQRGLYLRDVRKFKIKYPSIKVQQEIVQEIESRFSVIDKIEQVVEKSLIKAEELRKSILKSAFEGKLVKFEKEI